MASLAVAVIVFGVDRGLPLLTLAGAAVMLAALTLARHLSHPAPDTRSEAALLDALDGPHPGLEECTVHLQCLGVAFMGVSSEWERRAALVLLVHAIEAAVQAGKVPK
jgi:hypothetical protein